MAEITKPARMNEIWASTGTKTAPLIGKVNQGWVAEKPPYEYENWLENKRDNFLAHINQMGFPAWDNATEYQANKSYIGYGTAVWKCIQTHSNQTPAENAYWTKAFYYTNETYTKAQVDALIAGLDLQEKIGTLKFWPVNTPPTGWLVRDGSSILVASYPLLHALIGYSFGGAGASFTLPDDRGLFERGWDNGRGYDSGRVFGSEQDDDFESHTHATSNGGSLIGTGGTNVGLAGGSSTTNVSIANAGGTETRPKNRAYLPIIRAY
jgi:microcystin-dependent protein